LSNSLVSVQISTERVRLEVEHSILLRNARYARVFVELLNKTIMIFHSNYSKLVKFSPKYQVFPNSLVEKTVLSHQEHLLQVMLAQHRSW